MNNNTNTQEKTNKKTKQVFTDYSIFQGKIRLIDDTGKMKIVERDAAIETAKAKGMNLVQISYNKNEFPHAVCKILDYGKHLYELKKKEKENARKAREANAEAKEVYFSIRIDDGDRNTKIEHIKKFLIDEKAKVRVCVKLSRREMNLMGMAKDLMKSVLNSLDGIAELDSNPSFNSGIMACVLKPIKK